MAAPSKPEAVPSDDDKDAPSTKQDVDNDTSREKTSPIATPPDPAAKDSSEEDKASHTYLTGPRLWVVTIMLALCVFLLLLDISILSTATPKITSDFHSLPDVGWYVGAYQLASATTQPLTGKFYTHFRAKWTFLVFLFVFELGSLVCGVAPSSGVLIAGRAIAGLGSSGLMNGAATILAGAAPLEKRPLLTGIAMGIGQIGVVMGPLVGGSLTEYVTWRWCFYLNLPFGGLAAIFLTLIYIPDLTPKSRITPSLIRRIIPELDLPGFALFLPAATMLLLALQFGSASTSSSSWSTPTVIGLFVAAGVMAILFGLWEWRVGDRAMIPGAMLRNRVAAASNAMTVCFAVCMFASTNFLPIYFQAVRGAGPTESGVDLLPTILAQLVFVVVSGVGVSRFGYYLPWAVGGFAVLSVGVGLITTFAPETSTGEWIGYLILQGAGRGASMSMAMIAVQNALPPSLVPVALSFQIFLQNMSASIFIVVATTIFTESLTRDLPVLAPTVSPEAALAAGGSAAGVRALVPAGGPELDGVLLAYSNAIDRIFYMITAFAVLGVVCSAFMGWKDVRKKDSKDKAEAGMEAKEVKEEGVSSV